MANYGEGTIKIPLEEFWKFIRTYNVRSEEIIYGVPEIDINNNTMNIDYIFNSECNPTKQFNYCESKVSKQWQELELYEKDTNLD